MARFDVDVRIKPGQHLRRKVRARSGHAAYERVVREHVEAGGEWSMDLAIITRKGLRRRSTVLTGNPAGGPEDGGLAGVREPRRPKPVPPTLRLAIRQEDAPWDLQQDR
jgi:hypothetical protein